MFVSHELIAPDLILRRDYQLAIAVEATKRNTLVILPTGMGKTVVALLVMAHRVAHAPGKVLFLAPTKPLVEQHAAFLREAFVKKPVEVFTGETPPEEREIAWRQAAVVCSTPQVIRNDLISDRFDLTDVSLVVFDEAHRTSGNYAYAFIAERYRSDRRAASASKKGTGSALDGAAGPDGLVLGITASPGANADRIREVCLALGIEGVEVRTESDVDTRDYVQDVDVERKIVVVPQNLKSIADVLRGMLDEKVKMLRSIGAYKAPYVSKKELLATAARLQEAARQAGEGGAGQVYKALSAQAAALKINHALELVQTQGLGALEHYLERLASDESKAAKGIVADPRMAYVRDLADRRTVEHPKLRQVAVVLRQELAKNVDMRAIVFTNYRDTAELLVRELAKVDGVRPAKFVGQASRSEGDRGLTQKKQVQMVEEFKAGIHNVLVATSVAEEGLDIPATDLVLFYEPVPSEIRSIQRRGRTGRKRAGRVVILITKDTQDETYLYASRGKEKKMKKEIQALKAHFSAVNASERSTEWEGFFKPANGGQATLQVREERGEARARGVDGAASSVRVVAHEEPLPSFGAREVKPGRASAAEGIADVPRDLDGAPSRGRAVVVADHREFNSTVVRELARLDVIVKPETLKAGDFVLSDRLAVERKEASDYASSLIDGRLFEQARALRDSYSSPVLVIEGDNLLTARRIPPENIYASIASLTADYRITVLQTRDAAETAALLAALAKREQLKEKRAVALRSAKGAMTDDERLRFVVEGLPSVSAVLAKRILLKFKTIHKLARASVEELMEVDGIGEVTAAEIHRVLNTLYLGREES